MSIDFINTIVKTFGIYILAFITSFKIIGNKKISFLEWLTVVFTSCFLTFLYIVLKKYIDVIFIITLSIIIQSIVMNIMNSTGRIVSIPVLIANAISYSGFALSIAIELMPRQFLHIESNLINLILILIIETILILVILRLKRIKNGLSFLKNDNKNEYLELLVTSISCTIILAYGLFRKYHGDAMIRHDFITVLTLGVFMVIIVKKTLNLFYKQNLLKRTIEDYEHEIKEKDDEIEKLSSEKFEISKLNHEFYNRQKALEEKILNMNLESGNELAALDRIKDLTDEYSDKLTKMKRIPELPLTDIEEINDLFKYMQSECYKHNIEFNLQISGNIHYLVNNIIDRSKLETVIGDHIRDAIIAVNSSNNSNKSILAILGIKDEYYEFCVYDSGEEFDIDILCKLGLEPVTTHKDDGGSGIGFITTFETLKETKASLIIEEYNEGSNIYTKSITIRFDGKNEYIIKTYRGEEIKKKDLEDRIIIKNK